MDARSLAAELLFSPRMNFDSLSPQIYELDAQALAEVHDQLYPVVYRYVRFRLDNEQMVEDITSEVFLRMLDALQKDGRKIRDLRAWLLGTASHLVADHFRVQYRRGEDQIEQHEDLPDSVSTEGLVEKSFQKEEVRQAVQCLTEDQQHVLALRFSQEMSIEETARTLGKSTSAVKVLQFRALQTLRRLIGIEEKVQ